jgi:hypothetical protein
MIRDQNKSDRSGLWAQSYIYPKLLSAQDKNYRMDSIISYGDRWSDARWLYNEVKYRWRFCGSCGTCYRNMYRVSHNTWDYKNALGRPLNDTIESWEVSHFEAKDHIFQTRGVRFWCVDFFAINFSKNPTTQNLDDFIYVVILANFWQALAQTTDHLQKWPMDTSFHPLHAWYT